MTLSIIILNYNTKDLLAQAIDSINTKIDHEIIVVDNASTDGSSQFIQKKYPSVKLIKAEKNLGFAAGNNLGLKAAHGDFVLLLNSDTQIIADAIDQCVSYLKSNNHIGILTPKLILPDGAIDLACHRGFPTLTNSLFYFLKIEQTFPTIPFFSGYHQTYQDFDQIHQVDAVSGAAMFIRKKVIDQIGLLDERFFMYAEDIDFCLRAKNSGWQIVYFPEGTVIHHKGSSGTKSTEKSTQSHTRHHFYHTMKQYFDKHHRHPAPIRFIVNRGIDLLAKLRG